MKWLAILLIVMCLGCEEIKAINKEETLLKEFREQLVKCSLKGCNIVNHRQNMIPTKFTSPSDYVCPRCFKTYKENMREKVNQMEKWEEMREKKIWDFDKYGRGERIK